MTQSQLMLSQTAMAGSLQCCTTEERSTAPSTIRTSWTELACRLERVFSVPPERISEMESELIGGGTAETGAFEVNLQALKDFGFLVD